MNNSESIFLHDTAVQSKNLGDEIIMDCIRKELREIFKEQFFVYGPTHDYLGAEGYKNVKESPFSIVCGTNLLSGNMNSYNQWKINMFSVGKITEAILMGVGWWQYQKGINQYTKFLLKKVLSSSFVHSVRDEYTKKKLQSIGVNNVLNTGCPTMWRLDQKHCARIPKKKGDAAIITLTDYKPSPKYDGALVDIVTQNYGKIYAWMQGNGDYKHVKSIAGNKVEYLDPCLESLDGILGDGSISLDYVGTRLHAGIRAMQHHRRTIIVAVDNRATEMGKDFHLPVIDRLDINGLDKMVNKEFRIELTLPEESISEWKGQFLIEKGELCV